MSRVNRVIFSPVETDYLQKNKSADINQLCIALAKSVGAIKKKLSELKAGGIPVSKGPVKNKRSRIGKRPDCDNLFFRSGWESDCWRYFTRLRLYQVEYEPQTFTFTQFGVKRGQLSYTPDFRIHMPSGGSIWCEVKGWVATQDATKLRRFKKYYPGQYDQLWVVVGSRKAASYRFFKDDLGIPESRILIFREMSQEYKAKGLPGWES